MLKEQTGERSETNQRIKLRWTVMLVLGTFLVALGLIIDWPPQEATLPGTRLFLVIIGGLLGTAGLLAALRQE